MAARRKRWTRYAYVYSKHVDGDQFGQIIIDSIVLPTPKKPGRVVEKMLAVRAVTASQFQEMDIKYHLRTFIPEMRVELGLHHNNPTIGMKR